MSAIFTIIIPAYNAERYLRECLDSLVCQSFEDFEVIVVNDGSKDLTEVVCREYVETDNRFRLINKENGGVSTARNAGLEYANGEWILFMDADDTLINTALNEISRSIESNSDSVMHIWGWQEFFEDGSVRNETLDDLSKQVVSIEYLRQRLFECGSYMGYIWNKAFKRDLVGCLLFDEEIKYNEDRLFIFNYLSSLLKNNCCSILHTVLYQYRHHSESAMANVNRWNPLFITDIEAFYRMAFYAHNEGNDKLVRLIVHNAWYNIRMLKRHLKKATHQEIKSSDKYRFYELSCSLYALVPKYTRLIWYLKGGLNRIKRFVNIKIAQ